MFKAETKVLVTGGPANRAGRPVSPIQNLNVLDFHANTEPPPRDTPPTMIKTTVGEI